LGGTVHKKSKDLKDLNEVLKYWQEEIQHLSSKNDEIVAGKMTNVVTNNNWDLWYNESKGNYYFVKIFDLVAELELPSDDFKRRHDLWEKVRELLDSMEKSLSAIQ
jgi:hypothetical protein